MQTARASACPSITQGLSFELGRIQHDDTSVLVLDDTIALPGLQDLIDALTRRADQMSHGLLGKMEIDLQPQRHSHTMGTCQHQQTGGQALFHCLRGV